MTNTSLANEIRIASQHLDDIASMLSVADANDAEEEIDDAVVDINHIVYKLNEIAHNIEKGG